jgi:O-antigen/teichoic acid export membrane protein
MLMLMSAALRSYLLTVRGVLMGLERFGHEAGVMLADRVLMLAGGLVALRLGGGATGIALSFVITRGIALVAALAITRLHVGRLRLSFDRAEWRTMAEAALPLGAFMMVLNVYNYVDVLLLGRIAGEVPTGQYHNAYRLYEGLTYAIATITTVLTPRYAALWKSDRAAHVRLARRGLAGSFALGVVMLPVAWVLAPYGLELYGREYLIATSTLRILAIGLGPVFALWALHSIAMSTFRASLLVKATAVCLVINVALNLWWIPRWGIEGAAAATLAGETVAVLLLVWGLRDVILGRTSPA